MNGSMEEDLPAGRGCRPVAPPAAGRWFDGEARQFSI